MTFRWLFKVANRDVRILDNASIAYHVTSHLEIVMFNTETSLPSSAAPALRTRPPRWAKYVAVACAAMMVACASVKTTEPGLIGIDRTQRFSSLVSETELEQGAVQAYAQVLGEAKANGTLNTDAKMTARVRAIADRLIPQVGVFREDARNWNWQVNVLQSDQLNAWAMPGGKIAFYSGIINKLNLTDAEIAAIMGHEIAHALREHSRERASGQAITGLLTQGGTVLGSVLSGVDLTGLSQPAQMVAQLTFGLPNSRLHETEADRIGVELAARAGYDPRAAISVWQKMGKLTGGSGGPEFLSTHPSNESRISDLQIYSQKVIGLYQQQAS